MPGNGLALGLMSGTSADGISAALASFKGHSIHILDYQTFPYPKQIREKIINSRDLGIAGVSSLNFELGEFSAQCALRLMKKNKVARAQVAAIGSHGQTLFHAPRANPPHTLQIGESSVIAERTGATVVSDFRPRDIAAGGEGAPLMPFFDQFFFGNGPACALQNIGGMGNVTVAGKGLSKPIAFDTGPGNCLIDWAAGEITRGRRSFDKDGAWASKGRVLMKWIQPMIRHPYFRQRPPKSTGREIFNPEFIPSGLKKLIRKSPADVLSTLTYFTALTISESYKRFILPKTSISQVVFSGGGTFNKTLIRHLKAMLSPIPIYSIEKYGIHPQAKEPLAFAFFAWRAVQGKTNHLPQGTGAGGARILGKITPGEGFEGLR